MKNDFIKIRGARVHNLKNIDVDIPKNKLVVFCGVSGSGKSSLAFDTLYAEGQRRYVESLSVYARQFLGVMQKPDCDKIEGISPAISIDQKRASHNPRSTVGTMTEIYDYLRVLFAKVGVPYCPKCQNPVQSQTIDQMVNQVMRLPKGSEFLVLGPVVKNKKGEHKAVFSEIEKAGFVRVRLDGIVERVEDVLIQELDKNKKHNVEVVVDRLVLDGFLERSRLVDSLEIALRLGKGITIIQNSKFKIQNYNSESQIKKNNKTKTKDIIFSERFACEECGISFQEIEPRLFSFNSPYGACHSCQGLGKKLEVAPELVLPNKNLSLAEGAVLPWARASHKIGRQGWYYQLLEDVAQRNNFSLFTPIKDLLSEQINIILYGDRACPEQFDKFTASFVEGFEGVIPNLTRRYWETDSDAVREEIKKYMTERVCETCLGKRLKPEALSIKLVQKNIYEIASMDIEQAKNFFKKILSKKVFNQEQAKTAEPLIKEILNRLQFLVDVGLEYITLAREAETLSGGEGQRTRLATQIGSKLSGVLYILDEPSVGLHQRDQAKLIVSLEKLRDLDNSVIVVEHDAQMLKKADFIVDIGPGAGKHGGRVVFRGTPKQLLKSHTLTGDYLAGRKRVEIRKVHPHLYPSPPRQLAEMGRRQEGESRYLIIKGAQENNLKNINVRIPLGKFVCVSGVSGSGKSSLVNDIIAKALYKKFYHSKEMPGKYEEILGEENLDKVVVVDQSPIGKTPRSNPATYTGAFGFIRNIFSQTKEAKVRGYRIGRFSFNVKGGRCESCEGQGNKKIEMYFLPDVYVECDECKGKRYNQETLAVEYKNKNIADVLNMTIEDALSFFNVFPSLRAKLKTLAEVGLGYIELGQPAPSLSGGEAQRVKLAAELSKKATRPVKSAEGGISSETKLFNRAGKTLYILDEPTTGLHPDDIKKLISVLVKLVEKDNTVLAIEHNIDFIKSVDWLIDLGPGAGDKGGYIVAEGKVEDVAKNKQSYTAKYLL